MYSEKREQIERLKKELSDYLRLSELIGLDEPVKQKRIDIYLEDLSKLIKKMEGRQ